MDLPRADGWVAGHWRPWRQGPPHAPAALRDTAAIVCPGCGHIFCVVNHAIGADGRVSPSVVCPHAGCSFHVFVRLIGWSSP